MLTRDQLVVLTIEKPAAGGPMIARLDGQVVLVSGAIPGERVTARIVKVGKGVAHAQTVSVEVPSVDRREGFADPRCGGNLYAHIEYARQLDIKAQVVVDAFARIGRITLPAAVPVHPSPESGYRMRARLHVRGGRAGFFREGTHEVCDPRITRQLHSNTLEVLERLAAGLRSPDSDAIREIDVSENAAASERAVHLETALPIDPLLLAGLVKGDGLTGLSVAPHDRGPARAASADVSGVQVVMGNPCVRDTLSFADRTITLQRHVLSFFQGNRFLLRDLVAHVVDRVEPEGEVVDLYAGVGLFAIAVALVVGVRVTAVEGDRVAANDLDANARQAGGAVVAIRQPVEAFVAQTRVRPRTVILDPPRTGVSPAALAGVIGLGAERLIYVSCDVATLARDARHLLEAGYVIQRADGFDLFPNTPHVETVLIFDREGRRP